MRSWQEQYIAGVLARTQRRCIAARKRWEHGWFRRVGYQAHYDANLGAYIEDNEPMEHALPSDEVRIRSWVELNTVGRDAPNAPVQDSVADLITLLGIIDDLRAPKPVLDGVWLRCIAHGGDDLALIPMDEIDRIRNEDAMSAAPEDPTQTMIGRGQRIAQATGNTLSEAQIHDIWQAMYDEWQSEDAIATSLSGAQSETKEPNAEELEEARELFRYHVAFSGSGH